MLNSTYYNENHLDNNRELKRKLQSNSQDSKRNATSKRRRNNTPPSKNKSRKIKHPHARHIKDAKTKRRETQRKNMIHIRQNPNTSWSSNMNYFETLPYEIKLYKRSNDSRLDIYTFLDKCKGSKYDPFLSKIQKYFYDGVFNPITTQKYCDFVQSEILFRGNNLLYLLYLELYPYLVGSPQDEEDPSVEMGTGGGVVSPENAGTHQRQIKGGKLNLDKLKTPDCKILLIYAAKLLSELHHDFKGQGKTLKTLDNIVQIYRTNIEKIESICDNGSDNESGFFNKLMSGHGEWHFFKCTLDYLIDNGLFDELTIIKYRSVTGSNGQKDYFLLDMDGKEAQPLFEPGVFDIRYPDNSTCDSALSKLIREPPNGLDWKPKLIIQNAPSLTDPATIGLIDVAKFYPVIADDSTVFNFQKCQDLNNYFDPFNKIIIGIMCEGINTFFSLFGGNYANNFEEWNGNITVPSDLTSYARLYDEAPIKFVIMEGRTTKISPNDPYFNYLQNANTTQGPDAAQFFYSGIIIKSNTLVEYELIVGDTTIKNITGLVNDDMYVTDFLTQPQNEQLQTNLSWFRLCSLANYIKTTIPNDRFTGYNPVIVLKFLIVCLKALGDWFQVFYVSSIHYRCLPPNSDDFATQFNGLVKYLSSSDKNTIADMMIHSISTESVEALRFLGNGFSLKPSENLYKRFPAFFDNPAIPPSDNYGEDFGVSIEQTSNEDQTPPKGNDNDENEEVEDGAGVGSLKGIFLNFKKEEEDIKGKVQSLLQEQKLNFNKFNETDKQLFAQIATEQSKDFAKYDATYNDIGVFPNLTNQDKTNGVLFNLFTADEENANNEINKLTPEQLKTIKKCLTKIPLIYQVSTTNISAIETELKVAIDLQEAQIKAIGKIVESKHDPTRAEIEKLQSLFKSPVIVDLKQKLSDKITKLLGPSTILVDNVAKFSEKINNAVNDSRTKMSSFFGKMKSKAAQLRTGRSSGRSKVYGTNELIEEFDPVYNPINSSRGGRRRARRTMKRQHARTMKNRFDKQ